MMEQKKCLNCLCMSDMEVKVCPYCKTPFSSGRISPVPLSSNFRKRFNPPPLVTDEQKRSARITRNVREITHGPDSTSVLPAEDISFYGLLKNRSSKYSARLAEINPFTYEAFAFDSLEIEEIKPEIKTEEKIVIDGVNVDPDQLRELTDFALSLSPQSEPVTEEVIVPKEEKKDFDTKKVIRTSEENVVQKDNREDTNMGIRDVVEALESVSLKEKEPESTAVVRSSEHLNLHSTVREKLNETQTVNNSEAAPGENNPNTRPPQSTARGTTNNKSLEHYSTARMLCVQGNYDKALEELELAVKLDPAYEQAHILLSRTYLKLKNG